MVKDWKSLAASLGLGPAEVERAAPALEALESAFRPLAEAMPFETEPAAIFEMSPREQP